MTNSIKEFSFAYFYEEYIKGEKWTNWVFMNWSKENKKIIIKQFKRQFPKQKHY